MHFIVVSSPYRENPHQHKACNYYKNVAEAKFRELGIPDNSLADFMDWIAQRENMPTLDDIQKTEAGRLYAAALARFVAPRRGDKPVHASHPFGRLA
jgi:hypothetical protein